MGLALTSKILKKNGRFVHRSTYRALMPDEWENSVEKASHDQFEMATTDKLGVECR